MDTLKKVDRYCQMCGKVLSKEDLKFSDSFCLECEREWNEIK